MNDKLSIHGTKEEKLLPESQLPTQAETRQNIGNIVEASGSSAKGVVGSEDFWQEVLRNAQDSSEYVEHEPGELGRYCEPDPQ